MALSDVKDMRYDNGVGYVWVNDTTARRPRMIMHPTLPELDGTILDDPRFDCAMGVEKNLFLASVEVCQQGGSGYIDYLWPKPTKNGLTEELPKISYVRLFEPWHWVIGSGVYVDDIKAETQRRFDAVLTDLKRTLSRVRLAETGYIIIFSDDKQMLVHPTIGRGADVSHLINRRTGLHLLDELMEAAKTPSVPLEYTWNKPGHDSNLQFLKRAYVTRFEPLDWYIAASYYDEEMEKPAKALGNRIVFVSCWILLAAIAFAVVISKGLLAPLRRLTLAATSIEREGIDSTEIPISGTAETIELGTVLSKMINSVKNSEQELIKANVELEKLIADLRSAEAEREELIIALEAQNAQLERFTYTVSHDLKTPLITIKGHIGALSEDLKRGYSEYVQEDLAHIANAADRMASLLNDVLELSKIGRLVNPPEDVALDELVHEALRVFEDQIEQGGIRVDVSPDLPVVYGDRTRLLEVVQNLIENAAKYMGQQAEPQIDIGVRTDGGMHVYYVRDNGIGIEREYYEKIFSLFDQLDRNMDGTGIGLALVKRIVEVHGGRIWVESEGLGCGSTLCFSIAEKSGAPAPGLDLEFGIPERIVGNPSEAQLGVAL